MALLILLTLLLGVWQSWRGLGKYQLGMDGQANPVKWSRGIPLEHQQLQLSGRWLDTACLELGPRSRHGQAGHEMLCPLQLADGVIVLVNLGWQADARAQPALPALPVLTAPALLAVSQPWPRFVELGPTPLQGRRLQNPDPARHAEWPGWQTLPAPAAYAVALAPAGREEAFWRSPLSAWRHWGYALSWWLMSACGIVLWRKLARENW